jgi:hypothetical protein
VGVLLVSGAWTDVTVWMRVHVNGQSEIPVGGQLMSLSADT